MRATLTAPERVARELAQHGVKAAFGVPGGEASSELIHAMQRNGIRFVLCHTESQAAFSAASFAEVSGQLSVVLTSLGPGAASAINGAAHALLDRVPLLVITDRFAQEYGPACGHQFIDQAALYTPVTKRSLRLTLSGLAATVRDAISLALEQPCGPVHLDFAADLANAVVEDQDELTITPPNHPSNNDEASTDLKLGELVAALRRAARPVVVCGLEASAEVEPQVVKRLLELLRAPVLTTYKAIGVGSDSVVWRGGVFTGGDLEEAFLAEADLILTIGFDAIEMIPTDWRWDAPVLRLTASSAACPVSAPTLEVRGSLAQLVAATTDALAEEEGISTWTEAEVHDRKEQNHARVLASWQDSGINPTMAVQQLIDAFPSANFSVDAGAHMFAATLALSYAGARRCLISNGLSTMGFALPAAIGAACAEPGRPAIAITGDGGLSMCLAELETAVRSGHRVVVFLLNDAQLSLIKIKQEAKGRMPEGVGYGHTDWPAIAAAYGARSYRAATGVELETALAETSRQPHGVDFIEVVLAPGGYAGLLETVRGRKNGPKPPVG